MIVRKLSVSLAGLAVLCLGVSGLSAKEQLSDRLMNFTYEVNLEAIPNGEGPIEIFIPLAQSDSNQKILQRNVKANIRGKELKDKKYGNLFWHGHIKKSNGKPIQVQVEYLVDRKVFDVTKLSGPKIYTKAKKGELEQYLQANAKVPVKDPLIEKIIQDLPKAKDNTPLAKARAIYDYVVDTMDYKKVGTGWGNGDTYWACSKRYGNCTDFHALFISLARAQGIPARFEIGFPIPENRKEGNIDGYHCWVTIYVPEKGWFPIDASEAKKHPERKELYFGVHPANRILFTWGRDITLGKGHKTGPLNYFIYPHVEVAGKKYTKFTQNFRYKEEKAALSSAKK